MKTFSTFLSEAQSSSERAFLDNFYQRARRLGASDIDAKVIASQAALETGWGKSPSGQYNYFGQKAGGSERGTEKGTQEFGGGRMYSTSARFKDYDSLDSAISDRIKKWNYKTTGATDVSDATRRLMLPGGSKIPGTNQTSHGAYATDPDYVQKISSIASRFGDSPSRSSAPKPAPKPSAKGALDTPAPTRVLAKLKGKTGEKDLSTGKFTERGWSDTEGSRYKSKGGK